MTATREYLYEQLTKLADDVTTARHAGDVVLAEQLQKRLNEVNREYTQMLESLDTADNRLLKG
jgi:phosphate uptake regulator